MNTHTHAQKGRYDEMPEDNASESCPQDTTKRTTISVTVDDDDQVWINITTGVYHFPNQRWFANTRNGQYLRIGNANKVEHRATRNGQ